MSNFQQSFQESFSSSAYGGLSHHGLSRLSATSSLNGADFAIDDTASLFGVPIFDERNQSLEEKDSSGELYATPPNKCETPPPISSLPASSTATTPTTSGPGSLGSNGVRKKKSSSSWKNTLYPTYKSRSIEFKKLFTGLAPEERLIVGNSFLSFEDKQICRMRPELKLWLSIFGICIIEFMLAANNFTSSNFTGIVFVTNWFTNDKMQKKKKN